MTEIALDVRALQTAHATRGIGSYVRNLLSMSEYRHYIVWADLASPVSASREQLIGVAGRPSSRRFGWVRDAWIGRRLPGDARVHVPVLDVSLGLRPATITSIHDTIPLRFPTLYPAGRTGKVRRQIDRALARSSSHVVTASHAAKHDLERFLGIAPERIAVIGHPPDFGWERPGESSVQLPDRYVVMAAGFEHPDPRKRYGDALRALRLLPTDVHLVATGELGPQARSFMHRAAELGVDERVVLTGYVSTPQLRAIFDRAAALIFPSAWEGFGLPLVNAMAAGLPAVVSNGGALPEVAGGAALVHQVGDVDGLAELVTGVLCDARTREELRDAGRERSRTFSRESIARQYRALYESA